MPPSKSTVLKGAFASVPGMALMAYKSTVVDTPTTVYAAVLYIFTSGIS